ncbi:MAG: tRNA uridine-5-carboxymethylaminomethyl(34) synthesis GTPase MnmE, partial [Methylocystis sp.]|nr:tRNA uridine-5-carboxymethylaminomethyl(34) synthesis GTPase MnmE [Methylocystis sp.]
AEAGEFARRSFANGKLDLSQVEALVDLIDAQTELQRRQAVRVAGGALRRKIDAWRQNLVEAMALIEAQLDFSDEDDVGAFDMEALEESIASIGRAMEATLVQAPASERLRDGFLVVVAGPVNAGKSTLINALAGRDVAIVSDVPGTTRDMIEAHLDIGGAPVTIVDTAGLRQTDDVVERIGVDRTYRRICEADLVLWLSDSGAPPHAAVAGVEILRVSTKSDIVPAPAGWLAISAKTGSGVGELAANIAERARQRLGDGSALLIRERHRRAIEEASRLLREAEKPKPLELVAEDLRMASRSLGKITGAIDVDDVLDAIFSRFCIGK